MNAMSPFPTFLACNPISEELVPDLERSRPLFLPFFEDLPCSFLIPKYNSDALKLRTGFGDLGSRVSDDNYSVVAEQGSVAGLDSVLGDEDDENDGVDYDDDDSEGVESTELDEAFSAATAFVAATAADRVGPKLSNELQLQLYGLFKIATEGPCTAPMPPAFKMAPRAKWQAWQKLGAMPPEDAMQKYVDIVTDFPSWAGGATKKSATGDPDVQASESKGPMGPVFSSYVHEEGSAADLTMKDRPLCIMPWYVTGRQ
ncbi:hypothetical protein Droror1_Dr00026435 [Drosera rotundifolia]